jgi:hypothetical protein
LIRQGTRARKIHRTAANRQSREDILVKKNGNRTRINYWERIIRSGRRNWARRMGDLESARQRVQSTQH